MDMKKLLQAMDGISTKPVEGVDSMSKFLSVVTEAERVTDLGDGQKRIDYDDGTYDIQDGTGTTTYDSKGTALKHAGPNFGAQLTRDYTNGTQTRNMQKGPLSIKQTADTGGNVIQTDAEADLGSEKLSATFPAKHKTVPKMFQENDLSKFLSVVDKNDVSILSEGANPHKVTLPVQMAMQHYQKPQKSVVRKDRLIDKYFTEAETAITQRKEAKRAKINQYASVIAERVLMKESKQVTEAGEAGWGRSGMAGVGMQSIDELSTELLGRYKKAAGADAKKADADGDFERGNKRFKGINNATIKQFDNDAKKHEYSVSEDNDQEGATVRNSLHTIIRVATHLEKQINDNEDFPEWESEMIGSIKDQMVKVMDQEISKKEIQGVAEEWSQKYKKNINCSHPKGFSQKAHCAGKKKHNESIETEMTCPDCGMCETHGNLNEIKKGQKDSNGFTKCWPGKHAEGTKNGKNGKPVRNCVPNESLEQLLALRNKIDEAIEQLNKK